MVTITQLAASCEAIVTAIPEITGGSFMVIDQANTKSKLVNKPNIILVAAVPSAQSRGQAGMRRNENAVIFFILEKNKNHEDDVKQLERLQPIVLKLQRWLEDQAEQPPEPGCTPFYYLETGQISIDPVYNDFGGFNGWSLTIVF